MSRNMPPITYEKPIPHVSMTDWYAKLWQNHQTNDTRRNDSFVLRQEARQLRNETKITTEWNTYRNNERLMDRTIELDRWKETLTLFLNRVTNELNYLKYEKSTTERQLDSLEIPVAVLQECVHIRDCRRFPEITLDEVEEQLKKELYIIEESKKQLGDLCKTAWEKINDLEELICSLTNDISYRQDALDIDKEQYDLERNAAVITLKIDPSRTVKNSTPYDSWLNHSQHMKQLSEYELEASAKMRKDLFVLREEIKNKLAAQRDHVDFLLRKRIYDTQRVRNEVEWQQRKMFDEMEKLKTEIRITEDALQDKTDPLKLVETRQENRFYRPGLELANDKPEDGLKEERQNLLKSRKELLEKIRDARATYNALENQKLYIDRNLENKNHSLNLDVRCLDSRGRLRMDEFTETRSSTDRNIELVNLDKELVPK